MNCWSGRQGDRRVHHIVEKHEGRILKGIKYLGRIRKGSSPFDVKRVDKKSKSRTECSRTGFTLGFVERAGCTTGRRHSHIQRI